MNVVHVPLGRNFMMDVLKYNHLKKVFQLPPDKKPWYNKWVDMYISTRTWTYDNIKWFEGNMFKDLGSNDNVFYYYATKPKDRKKYKDEDFKLHFINRKMDNDTESLIKYLSIPLNSNNKCWGPQIMRCTYINASLLVKSDIPVIKKMSMEAIHLCDKYFKHWENLEPFHTGIPPPNSNVTKNKTPIHKNMDKKTIYNILNKEWDLCRESSIYIMNMILYNKRGLKPIWYQGFHLSPNNRYNRAFSQPYLHLHTCSLMLMTNQYKRFLRKTCPLAAILQVLSQNN